MFGLLNIDKPAGMTSRDVVNRVVPLVRPDKVGHAGTLDPLATGVLVLCIGKATRLVPWIQEQPKTYRAVFRLGCTSDTDDVDGEVRELADAPAVTLQDLDSAVPGFVGRIEQVPPRFSAVKIKGRRAYDLARHGKQPEVSARTVHVHRLDIVEFSYPNLTLQIECGSGTYVRAIGRDLGRAVGSGAVMTELRRLRVGVFHAEQASALDELNRASVQTGLLPAALALAGRPCCTVSPTGLTWIKQGRRLPLEKVSHRDAVASGDLSPHNQPGESADVPLVAVLDGDGNLIAIAEREQSHLVPRQVFA